ncbi:MAG: hypothetical protein ACJARX_000092 [Psychroserpens sp.]|jgi:hypothetical protein|uniref:hypothetical protein n=1 Tax=Psychroserpens sp. TaxID=2020870 RepID=UPI0039E371E7
MAQYQLKENKLTLSVKPSPIFVRILMFAFSFMLFILPVSGMISSISEVKGIQSGFFISIFVFGLMVFYLLRIALWNTYEKKELVFQSMSALTLQITVDLKTIIQLKHYKQ